MTIHEQEAEEALGKWSSSKYAIPNDRLLQKQHILGPSGSGWREKGVEGPIAVFYDDEMYLFVTGRDGNWTPRIGLFKSPSGYGDWEEEGVIIGKGGAGTWSENGVRSAAGTVLWESEDGVWKMYFLGYDGDDVSRVGVAESPDLLNWTVEHESVVESLTAGKIILGPAVFKRSADDYLMALKDNGGGATEGISIEVYTGDGDASWTHQRTIDTLTFYPDEPWPGYIGTTKGFTLGQMPMLLCRSQAWQDLDAITGLAFDWDLEGSGAVWHVPEILQDLNRYFYKVDPKKVQLWNFDLSISPMGNLAYLARRIEDSTDPTGYEKCVIDLATFDLDRMLEKVTGKHIKSVWANESVSAGTWGYSYTNKDGFQSATIYFESDTVGDLTIEVNPSGMAGDWHQLDVRTNTDHEVLDTEYNFAFLRMKFSADATLTAKVNYS